METEVELRDTELKGISHIEAGKSGINTGITETEKQNENNCENEMASSSSMIQALIPNDTAEEVQQKEPTVQGQDELEKSGTIAADNGSVDGTDLFSQTMMEIDSVQGHIEAGRSGINTGITETEKQNENNCENEMANSSSMIQPLIPNVTSEEVQQKDPTVQGQDELEKSGTIVADNGCVDGTDLFSQTTMEVDSVQGQNEREKPKPKSPRKRKPLTLRGCKRKRQRLSAEKKMGETTIKCETMETPDEPKNEIVLLPLANLIENDSISNDGRSQTAPEIVRENKDNASRIEDEDLVEISSLTTSMSNDFLPKSGDAPKRRGRGRPPKKKIQPKVTIVNKDSENQSAIAASTTVLSTSNSAENKFVPKRRRSSLEKVIEAQRMKMDDETAGKNRDTFTEISSIISSEDLVPKTTSTPKCMGKGRNRGKGEGEGTKKTIAMEISGINNDDTKTEVFRDTTAERLMKIDETIEAVIQEAIQASQLEELTKEIKPAETGTILKKMLQTEKMYEFHAKSLDSLINDEMLTMYEKSAHSKSKEEASSEDKVIDKAKCRSPKQQNKSIDDIPLSEMKHNVQYSPVKSISKENSSKNVFDELKQAKVLLFDIAHSNKLTPRVKEMLSRIKKSNQCNVSSRNSTVSSANQSVEKSAAVDINKASPKVEKTSINPKHTVSHKKVKHLKDESWTPKKRQRSRTPKTKTQSNIAKKKNEPAMPISILQTPHTASMSGTEIINTATNIDRVYLLSSSNVNSQQTLHPSDRFDPVQLTQWPIIKSKLPGPAASDSRECEKQSTFGTEGTEFPLNLSIRSSNKSMDCRSDVFKSPNTPVVKSASQSTNFSLPHHRHAASHTSTVPKTEFGRSYSNFAHLDTSLTNFQYHRNLSQPRRASESKKERDDVNGNGKLQEVGNRKSNLELATEQTRTMDESSKNYGIANEAENLTVKCKAVSENSNAKINTVSTARSLPRIVADEALPKGTISFPSVGCKLALRSNDEDERYLNHATETRPYQETSNFRDDKMIKTQPKKSTADNDDREVNSIGAEAYDSSELWRICPELENFFEEDDDNINNNNNNNIDKKTPNINGNNNNEKKLSNVGTMKTNEVTKDADPMIAAKEIVTNTCDEDLLLNSDGAHVAKTKNDPRPTPIGVVATNVNYIANEMDTESLESIVTEIETEEKKKPLVLGNLTIANLTNFTKNSNHDVAEDRLNIFVENNQYFLYSETENTSEFLDENKVSNVCDETCGDARIVSTLKNEKIQTQSGAKTLKRKWIQDICCKLTSEKRRKLNRKISSGNTEGNSMAICSFPIASSVGSNNSKDSLTKVIDVNTLPDNASCEITLIDEEVREDAKTVKEIEIIHGDCNVSRDHNLNVPDRDKIEKSTLSVETTDAIVDNENLLKDRPSSTTQAITMREESDSKLDENGNLTSSSSSSSSSCSSSSKSTGESGRSISSSTHDAASLGKNDSCRDKCELQKEPEEELDYEPDDCISLFAESIISTKINENLNFINYVPSYEPTVNRKDSFHDMRNVVDYYEKNVQECNAAYESATEIARNWQTADPNNTRDTLACKDTSNSDMLLDENIAMPKTNLKLKNWRIPLKYSAPDLPQDAFPDHKNNAEPLINLNSRSCMNTDSSDNIILSKLFKGHCYIKMRNGVCSKKNCQFSHYLSKTLQNIDQKDIDEIYRIFNYAIYFGYKYFTSCAYSQLFVQMEADKMLPFFYQLLKASHLSDLLIKITVDGLAKSGIPLQTIVKNIAHQLDEDDNCTADQILSAVGNLIEPGFYWETFRDLLVMKYPPIRGLDRVIKDCIYNNKSKSHVRDVYVNYVRKFTADELSNELNGYLKQQFDSLVAENKFISVAEKSTFDTTIVKNANFYTVSENQISAQYYAEERYEIPPLMSPDSIQQSEKVSQFLLQKDIQVSQRSSSQASFTSRYLEKNETGSSSSKASTHNFFKQRRDILSQGNSLVKDESPGLNIATRKIDANDTFDGTYNLHPIDDLLAPQSAYRDRHREFHLWVTVVNDLLEDKNYKTVLDILDKYSGNMDETLFTTSLYNVLRKNVMTSASHLENMIKLSVEMRVGKFLSRTLFSLGIYTMIKLCDTGTWVLAYGLFKFLRNTGSLENTAAITLISAEICLANGHPLKAFNMLKCKNMFTPNRSKWRLDSNPNDEPVRVRVMSLLLDELCEEYLEWGFHLFKELCREQGHTYYPIDLTAIIDKLVIGIMNMKCSELLTDVGRFVLKSHFALGHCVLRNLVVKIFEIDSWLSKQLYHYGNWLGIYPIVQLTLPLRILIKTNWTKEEMYLVIADFLEKLLMDLGPAIDRIGPNKFTIYLVFELAPFKSQLVDGGVQMCNIDELKISKKLIKAVLLEQFNPPINTIRAEQDRIIKLQSRSVVDYLKSMSARQ